MTRKRRFCVLDVFLLSMLLIPLTAGGARDGKEHGAVPPGTAMLVSGSTSEAGPVAGPVLPGELGEELFALADERLLLADNRVKEQIDFFTSSGRKIFQAWLDQSSRYCFFMRLIFRSYDLPEDLVYVAMIESGFRLHAVSPALAAGPWQFMPETAGEYGLVVNEWIDERRDPVKSTIAAASHLKYLYGRFGSWPLALASYNAGEGTVRRVLLQSSEKGLAGLYGSRTIGRETREYVPRLAAAIILTKDPERFGFIARTSSPFRYDVVHVESGMHLRVIAAWAGCTVAELKRLNPELLKETTPPYARNYHLRVPPGTNKGYGAALPMHSECRAAAGCDGETACWPADDRGGNAYALLWKQESFGGIAEEQVWPVNSCFPKRFLRIQPSVIAESRKL